LGQRGANQIKRETKIDVNHFAEGLVVCIGYGFATGESANQMNQAVEAAVFGDNDVSDRARILTGGNRCRNGRKARIGKIRVRDRFRYADDVTVRPNPPFAPVIKMTFSLVDVGMPQVPITKTDLPLPPEAT
jgi:hypothetical protein